MEKEMDTEGNSSTESYLVTYSSSPKDGTNPEAITFTVINEEHELNHQQRVVINDSEMSLLDDVPDSTSLFQLAQFLSENADTSGTTSKDVIDALSEMLHQDENQFEHGSPTSVADVQTNNCYTASSKVQETEARTYFPTDELSHSQVELGNASSQMAGSALYKTSDVSDHLKEVKVNRGLIDTAAPFESVRQAVSKFGGIAAWKTQKAMTVEKLKNVQPELEKTLEDFPDYKKQSELAVEAKVQVLKELDITKRRAEELKVCLEKAQTQEAQAKQDSELAELRVKEMEQGIANEASIAAKQQLEVAKERYTTAVAELKSVKEELDALQKAYVSLVNERDIATRKAEESVSASKEIEKTVEYLTLELLSMKEMLESAQSGHLEAEEHKITAALVWEQDRLNWEKELRQAEEELQQLNEQLSLANDLKTQLDAASTLLFNLKAELAAYIEEKLMNESEINEEEKPADDEGEMKTIRAKLVLTRDELEEVKTNIENVKDEVNCLRVAAASLESDLDREKKALTTIGQGEGLASVSVSSLEAELNRVNSELELILMREKEAKEKMAALPKTLQQAAQEADQAKSLALSAQEELKKVKEEAEQAKAGVITMETRLISSLKEIEAAKVAERVALAAVKALEEGEQAGIMESENSPSGVTLPLDEYYILSNRAREAEELANERVISAMEQIKEAKESESSYLEKLDEANKKIEERKMEMRAAMEEEEKANEGKLGVEQELRKWRAEHEQRRKESDASAGLANFLNLEAASEPKGPADGLASGVTPQVLSPRSYMERSDTINTGKKMRRHSFFPRIVMFLARKKAQSLK